MLEKVKQIMFDKKKILVIGDIMLDIYYRGEVNRISPEAPVPVFKKDSEMSVLGGAANVAANLSAAGQRVSMIAVTGKDMQGKKIIELFSEIGVEYTKIAIWDRPTITKTRFLAENNQQVLRVDVEESEPISDKLCTKILDELEKTINNYDLIVLSDYMKGLLTYNFTQGIIKIANNNAKKVIIDVKDPAFEKYEGAYLLKPNQKELQSLTGKPVETEEQIIFASQYILDKAKCKYILTTCGSKGMILVGEDVIYKLSTSGKAVYDVTGAGDTTIAYLSAGIANGLNIIEAMKISNYAAGLQVGKVGTSAVYLNEVEEAIKARKYGTKKVFHLNERNELGNLVNLWKSKGESIVTTNGCFDIIHRGHISLLEEARSYGEHLIVLINTDASVKRLKGENRPINTEEDRAAVIAALDCVDAVMLFDPLVDNTTVTTDEWKRISPELRKVAEEAPMGTLKFIAPDVHVKGGDYTMEQAPEAVFAKKFRAVPFIKGYSTTSIIKKVEDNYYVYDKMYLNKNIEKVIK